MHNMKPAHGAKPEMKLSMPAVKRLLSYQKQYRGILAVVTVCILLSAGATAAASLFLQVLRKVLRCLPDCYGRSSLWRRFTAPVSSVHGFTAV